MISSRSLRAPLASLLLTCAVAAIAAPASLPLTINGTFNNASWILTNSAGTITTCNAAAFGLNDASAAGGSDAYDGAWSFTVDGVAIVAPGNTVDLTGSTVTAGPISASGLNVTVQHFYAQQSSLARFVLFLQNPNGAPATVNVVVPVNFGSDGSTVYHATSSGDAAVTTADRWIVSSDTSGPGDPVNTTVFYGPDASVTPASYTTSVANCAGTQGLGASFNVTVPAGTTRSLMFFAGLAGVTEANNTVASAVSSAALFNSSNTLRPEWLTGLSTAQQSQIVNWNFFISCADEGFTGSKLTLCQRICEVPQTPATLTNLIRLYTATYRQSPPCGL